MRTTARVDRITIQYDASAAGVVEPNWTDRKTGIVAGVASAGGREKFWGRQMAPEVEFVVDFLYRSSLTVETTDRVVVETGPFAGKVLGIKSVEIVRDPLTPPFFLLQCGEVV